MAGRLSMKTEASKQALTTLRFLTVGVLSVLFFFIEHPLTYTYVNTCGFFPIQDDQRLAGFP